MALIFEYVILQHILIIDILSISSEIALIWVPQNLTEGKSILDLVMGCCRQAITWTNVDPDRCCHMVSLGHNELSPNIVKDRIWLMKNYFFASSFVGYSGQNINDYIIYSYTTPLRSTLKPCWFHLVKKHFELVF